MIADWVLLLPILFPMVGVVIFMLITPRIPLPARFALPIIFALVEIVMILINVAPGTHRFTVSDWSAATFVIALQGDGITLLLLLTMFVPLIALWLIAPPRRSFDVYAVLVLTGAIFLSTAGNALTMYIAWACFDVMIFIWRFARNIERETAMRGIIIGQISGLVFFAGAVALAAGQSATGATLIGLGLWARLGIFPFHHLLPTRGVDVSDLWLARGIPLIAALNLWLHWSLLKADVPYIMIGTLAGIALIVPAIWVWREETMVRAVGVSVSQAAALVPLAITFGRDANVAIGLWLTLAAVFALALFEIALRWRADNLNRWSRLIWFAALFSLVGLPLTPAFIGRIGVYVALWESNNWLLMLIAGLSTLVVSIPLWGFGFIVKGGEVREPSRIEYVGLAIMITAYFALAFLPTIITRALGTAIGNYSERAIDMVIRTDDAAGVGLGIATAILPVIIAFFAQPYARDIDLRFGTFLRNTARLVDLEWVERWLIALGYRLGVLARNLSSIAEENPTVWLLFVALWVAILIMIAR